MFGITDRIRNLLFPELKSKHPPVWAEELYTDKQDEIRKMGLLAKVVNLLRRKFKIVINVAKKK